MNVEDSQPTNYFENFELSQGMDIELEEEIISCDSAPKVSEKQLKTPTPRKNRKKKTPQMTITKTINSLSMTPQHASVNQTSSSKLYTETRNFLNN